MATAADNTRIMLKTFQLQPANRWQRLKLRLLPEWALKRWPVQFVRKEVCRDISGLCKPFVIAAELRPPHNWLLDDWLNDVQKGMIAEVEATFLYGEGDGEPTGIITAKGQPPGTV